VIDAGLMHWLKNYAFASHWGDWLVLAVVVVLSPCASVHADLSSGCLHTQTRQRQR
jgi:hypothetical protein